MRFDMMFIKKIALALSLMMVSNVSFANTNDVSEETEKLILESIRLELSHNYSLRDPQDNQPLDIDESTLNVYGMSVFLSPEDGSANYDYKVEVVYEAVDGETGTLLCSVPLKDLNGLVTVKKADCIINLPVETRYNQHHGPNYSIHEIFGMMSGRL